VRHELLAGTRSDADDEAGWRGSWSAQNGAIRGWCLSNCPTPWSRPSPGHAYMMGSQWALGSQPPMVRTRKLKL